jgi:hypothetical protein
MSNPFFYTILLYLLLAIIGAADAALTSYQLTPFVNGLRWFRIHLVTLGVVTQTVFAVTPALVASYAGKPRPKARWDIWALLNIGLVTLIYGIPLINRPIILTGGTLIFFAAALLVVQLYGLGTGDRTTSDRTGSVSGSSGRKFYLVGLLYLLLGIFIGTGLWRGWPALLHMNSPTEVHIHANNWGFVSFVFAGLIIDTYPDFAGRALAWPRSVNIIFGLLLVGSLGLIAGPWLDTLYLTGPGVLLEMAAIVLLLLNMVVPLVGGRGAKGRGADEERVWTPGMWHLLLGYFWLIGPILLAPALLLTQPAFSATLAGPVEGNAPKSLTYGWRLQVSFALVPYFFRRVYLPDEPARLGGNWFSLILVNLGSVCLWASILVAAAYNPLHATAYALWALSLIPIVYETWRIARRGSERVTDIVNHDV